MPHTAIIDKRLLVIIHHQRTVIQVRVATHNYDSLSQRITLWTSPEVREDFSVTISNMPINKENSPTEAVF